nr:MAG TPA: hypothetical protein [Caudoviricetes sp.]
MMISNNDSHHRYIMDIRSVYVYRDYYISMV